MPYAVEFRKEMRMILILPAAQKLRHDLGQTTLTNRLPLSAKAVTFGAHQSIALRPQRAANSTHWACGGGRRTLTQGLQQLGMDAPEAAIAHHHDLVAGARLARNVCHQRV